MPAARAIAKKIRDVSQLSLVPRALQSRWTKPDSQGQAAIEISLLRNYYKRESRADFDASLHEDFDNHSTARLAGDRTTVIPWLSTLFPLHGAKIIEIGAGTGSSTIALAEQGVSVIGFDIRSDSIEVARTRCVAHHVTADLRVGNATEIPLTDLAEADAIIYFACVEHMTLDERITSLRQVWTTMKRGAHLVVIETPNRLWWYDYHTSKLPFYNWLPDDLAILYADRSPRQGFAHSVDAEREGSPVRLAREGRGVSYHEFEVAMDEDLSALEIFGMRSWLRRNPVHLAKWLYNERAFQRRIRRMAPRRPAPFFEYQLDFAVRKA